MQKTSYPLTSFRQCLDPLLSRPIYFVLAGSLPAPALIWFTQKRVGPCIFKKIMFIVGLAFLIAGFILLFRTAAKKTCRPVKYLYKNKSNKSLYDRSCPKSSLSDCFCLKLRKEVGWGLFLLSMSFCITAFYASVLLIRQTDLPRKLSQLETVVVKADKSVILEEIHQRAGLRSSDSGGQPEQMPLKLSGRKNRGSIRRQTVYLKTVTGEQFLLQLKGGPRLHTGDKLLVSGLLEPIPGARNPGGFPSDRYYSSEGIWSRLRVTSDQLNRFPEGQGGWFKRKIEAARLTLAARLLRLAGPEVGKLGATLLLGLDELLDEATTASFYAGGLGHLLAVSGTHIGILADLADLLVDASPLRKRYAWPLRFLLVLLILILTGGGVSVRRAFIMRTLSLACEWRRRRGDGLNHLAVAMLVLIVRNPFIIFKRGFHFSCGVTFGLLTLLPLCKGNFGGLEGQEKKQLSREKIQGFLFPSLVAGLCSLPFQLAFSGRLSLFSLPANLLAIPLVHLLIIFTLLVLMPVLHYLFPLPLAGAAKLLQKLADLAAMGETGLLPRRFFISLAVVGIFYSYLLLGVSRTLRRRFSLILVAVCGSFLIFQFLLPQPAFIFYCFDVDQGDSLFLQTRSVHMLVDTGTKEAAEQHLLPALEALDVKRLDCLVITHLDEDHCGGVAALLDQIRVKLILAPPLELIKKEKPELATLLQNRGVELISPRAGQRLVLGEELSFKVLHPESYSNGKNEDSICLYGGYGDFKILLTGDIGFTEEDLIMKKEVLLQSTLLKLPHHGSAHSSKPAFLERTAATLAVVSAGEGNFYGHPDERVLKTLKEQDVDLYRTDQDGCIKVAVSAKNKILARTYLSRKRKIFQAFRDKSVLE